MSYSRRQPGGGHDDAADGDDGENDDDGNDDDDDEEEDEEEDGNLSEVTLEDEERLTRQLEFEVAEIARLNASLDSKSRQSPYFLLRCLCGTRSARTISVWFFTFLIFGVVEVMGAVKVRVG